MSRFGATILDADGLRLSRDEKAFFRDADPFGFIVFARNIDHADQVYALTSEMREAVGRDAVVTVDQEGGRVQRLRAPHWREWTPALEFARQAGDALPEAMYLRGRVMAHELRGVGIDSNCAPLLDIATDDTHPFLRNRCYGTDRDTVVTAARAMADGMLAGGVLPVMKHMPGHGRAHLDSHHDLPHVTTDKDILQAEDFKAFSDLADTPMGMTAHLVYEAYDDAPATLSPVMIEVIRKEIGFDNLLMTDDIGMQALSGTPAQRAAGAVQAGCDIVLYCNDPLPDRIAVAAAAGPLSEEGQARAERAVQARRAPDDIDISALDAQLEALLGGQVYG